MRVLLVKMSSLGDVVHTFPALTDAAAHGIRFHWVVEEAFAEVAALHPAVDKVIPIAWRRWRRDLSGSRGALADFRRRLRSESYDRVLDAQGLIKSGVVTALARADAKSGLAPNSARERAAAIFYPERVAAPWGQHAIDRLRQLFAGTFGYPLSGPENFGISLDAPRERNCVLLHGASWASKLWPPSMWVALAKQATERGLEVVLPWGDAHEHQRAEQIAQRCGAEPLPQSGLDELAQRLAGAALVVGVDSGLSHLSAALGVPTVVLYGATDSHLTGCRGDRAVSLQAQFPCSPCLSRECGYAGEAPHWQGEAVQPACYSRLAPQQVWQAATGVMDADRLLPI